MRSLRFPLIAPALLLLSPSPSDGAIFPCDEAGFDQALDAAGGGDGGPHSFACAPEDLPLVLSSGKSLGSSLTIDGESQLVLQGLDVMLFLGPSGSILELRDLTLIDARVGSLRTGQALELDNVSAGCLR